MTRQTDLQMDDALFALKQSSLRSNDYKHLPKDARSLEIERGVQDRRLDEILHLQHVQNYVPPLAADDTPPEGFGFDGGKDLVAA